MGGGGYWREGAAPSESVSGKSSFVGVFKAAPWADINFSF